MAAIAMSILEKLTAVAIVAILFAAALTGYWTTLRDVREDVRGVVQTYDGRIMRAIYER